MFGRIIAGGARKGAIDSKSSVIEVFVCVFVCALVVLCACKFQVR